MRFYSLKWKEDTASEMSMCAWCVVLLLAHGTQPADRREVQWCLWGWQLEGSGDIYEDRLVLGLRVQPVCV